MTQIVNDQPINDETAPNERLGFFLLMVLPIMGSSNMLIARATADLIPPIALSFWRWAITLLLMSLFFGPKLWRQRADIKHEWKDLILMGALGMGVCGAFVYIGAATTTATNIGLIYAASPVMIIIMGRFIYGETLSAIQTVGVAICLLGVLIIIAKGSVNTFINLKFTIGDLWIAAATCGWALYSILQKHRPTKLGIMRRLTATTGAGVLVLLPFTIWEGAYVAIPTLNKETIIAVVFLALVPSFAAYATYAKIQKIFGAAKAGLVMYLIPVVNSLLAWALLGENLEPYHYLGAAMVLPGIWLSTKKKRIG